jgi:hypothetical protein
LSQPGSTALPMAANVIGSDVRMRQELALHRDSPCLAATHIEVEVTHLPASRLALSYIVTGKISDIRLPPVMPTAPGDELWRHTCFEAFVRASSEDEYYEFNFAPSMQWAAYRFRGYRNARCVASEIGAPTIEVKSAPDRYTLQASLDLSLSRLPRKTSWRLGLSAVIEETSGCKSYWALAHPPGKPDFHHADSFSHELSPVVQP